MGQGTARATGGYQLERVVVSTAAPVLDDDQQRVVDHTSGPLLVLAGPGTGKTTTLVEAVVDRLETRAPGQPLVLTFSRRAAADLRQRIAGRLGRSTTTPLAFTFHSFCYALLRRFATSSEPEAGLRLLTAPEQEFRVRETLAGARAEGRAGLWPGSLEAALDTRGFAGELRSVVAKARQLGMDAEDLCEVAETTGRPEWTAAGEFMEEYLTVLDFEQALDYSELVHRSRILLTDPEIRDRLRGEINGIFVDEFQDTDPAQISLVAELAGAGGTVVAVGDPDQSIYGFRGASARGILDFPDHFRTDAGEPAPVVSLGHSRRFGIRIADATRNIADRLPLARALDPEVLGGFRRPVPDPGRTGRVEVYTCESAGSEAAHIADILRQAHLHDGLAWGDMAVLVRSGRRNLPGLSRALTAAGVPIEVAGDEIALSAELAVRPLLLALGACARPDGPDVEEAASLLVSPLGGLDGLEFRRLGRLLRDAERAELAGAALPETSGELCRRALVDLDWLDECRAAAGPSPVLDRARALAQLLADVRGLITERAAAEDALWALWVGTNWPERLRRESQRGGLTGRRADRDLDALLALFDFSARSTQFVGARGVLAFQAEVQGQQIPADTEREADLLGRGVRLMTAHRSKGLEWPLVVVASVQEGGWPDLRLRGSLLEADRLGRVGGQFTLTDPLPVSARLAEERRLFYVACTRARQRLIVTAVEGTEGEGDQPSRFLTDLKVPVAHLPSRPSRPLTLTGLVGELRRTVVDPEVPARLRDAAAVRLARLSDATDHEGRPLAADADPRRWWGMSETSQAPGPLVDPKQPVDITGSALSSILACPRQWFLGRRASADTARTSAASTGDVLHVLVAHAANSGTDAVELADHLDTVWGQIGFDATYLSAVERVEAIAMLERYAAWAELRTDRELLGTEVRFRVTVPVAGDQVVLTGSVDRLERLADGRLHIVDFKTGRSLPDKRDIPTHEQLGVYQLAAQHGAFEEVAPGERRVSGAELVYLRHQTKGDAPYPTVFHQESLDVQPRLPETDPELPTWVHGQLAEAASVIREERFDARLGPACRWCQFSAGCPARGQEVVA